MLECAMNTLLQKVRLWLLCAITSLKTCKLWLRPLLHILPHLQHPITNTIETEIKPILLPLVLRILLYLLPVDYKGTGVVQWWECLPPTNVSQVWFQDQAACGLNLLLVLSLLWEVFLQVLRFPLSSVHVTNILKFQFNLETKVHRFVSYIVRLFSATLVKQSRFVFTFASKTVFLLWLKGETFVPTATMFAGPYTHHRVI